MILSFKAGKTGPLLIAGALLLFSVAPARAGFGQNADTSQMMSRINQLETQVQTLSRSVYRGGGQPIEAAPMADDSGICLLYTSPSPRDS